LENEMLKEKETQEQNCVGLTVQREARCTNDFLGFSDKDLLTLAAKSLDLYLEWDGHPDEWQPMYYEGKTYHSWNPLEDDGDAFRLAMKLSSNSFYGITLHLPDADDSTVVVQDHRNADVCIVTNGTDSLSQTRKAIVLVAAQIGREFITPSSTAHEVRPA
jgi:hypothetical protein